MNPALLFLLIFIGIPLFELYWIISIGSEIGAASTLFLVVATAIIGGIVVRLQGISTAMRVRDMISRDEIPAIEMLEGAVLFVCGLLLVLPGFFTDAIGFLLLIPPLRRKFILLFLTRAGIIRPPSPDPKSKQEPRVIEGEYRREED